MFIVHFYYGICSELKMLYEKYEIELYYTLFWDHENKTYKCKNYMSIAIGYIYHPILCILVTITICILSISAMVRTRNEKGKKKIAIILISLLILLLSLVITFGVIYCYRDEMAHESV